MSQYVHLHNHTHYSILDAISTVEELVMAAKADEQTALAITDHGVMFGVIEFYEKCKANGIKPIIGCEVYIANGNRVDKTALQGKVKTKNYFHLLLLAKNEIGYKNLLKLSSIGHTEGYYARPRIDKESLAKYHEGLVCTSACMGGIIPHMILREKDYNKAKVEALFYKEIFGDDFYIELQYHHYEIDNFLISELVKLANEINVKIIATNDIHYIKKSDAIAHNVFLSIKDATGKEPIDINKLRYKTDEFYFRTQAEMIELFKNYPEAISNTLEIAEKCNLTIELGKLYMPQFPIPEDENVSTLDDYLKLLVYEGLQNRYTEITEEIKQRAEYELGVIKQMEFPGYFLIVWDFIRAAKELGTGVGPGRGSAAGSIVAYALGITNIDPLKYNLLFERFLNPERVSMPDIDIDFNDETRDRVIDYVKNKYGENSVAQIVTFGTLSTRAVIQDVGRVLGLPLDKVRRITKEVNVNQGKVESIDVVMKKAVLDWVKDEDERFKKLFEFCKILENKNRNTGTHAAGVVIAPSDISDFVPLYKSDKTSKSQNLENVSQFEMSYLEKAGLVKMDFLGLRTLSIIERALKMIRDNHNIDVDLDKIDFDDSETYKMLSNGQTKAIFQFESGGMTDYLKKLKPQNLEELTAMNALYRPGPMNNIPSFINRKLGTEKIEYLHPLMEKSLKNTYGVIVYQEQVMQLVQDLAGFSLGQADLVRRAMGKKQLQYLLKERDNFAAGCKKNGIDNKTAIAIWELIEKFASYGFNKSHSLAYSYLAFQTAWLKCHYTAEYLAAFMTAEMNEQKKLVELMAEAKNYNINILLPDVNTSNTFFVAKDNDIIFGIAGIKGVGTGVVENIVEARNESQFTSIFDFAARVEQCNKRVLEALICAGAFDKIYSEKQRSQLYASVDLALEYAKSAKKHQEDNTEDLFASVADEDINIKLCPQLIFSSEWETLDRINKEKEVLNFYFSGHPLDKYYLAVKSLNSTDLIDYSNYITAEEISDDDKEYYQSKNNINSYGLITGLISNLRTRNDKRGNTIAFVTLQNYDGEAEIIFWSDAYEKFSSILVVDTAICCQGKIEKIDGVTKLTVDEAYSAEDAINRYTTAIEINIDKNGEFDDNKLNELKNYIDNQINIYGTGSGNIRFVVKYNDDKNREIANYFFTNSSGINYRLETLTFIEELFGENKINNVVRLASLPVSATAKRKYRV